MRKTKNRYVMKANLLILFIVILFFRIEQTISQEICIERMLDTRFYGFVPNSFTIIPHGLNCDSIIVSTENGRISKIDSTCYYTFVPNKYGFTSIDIKRMTNKDTILIKKINCSITDFPSPTAYIGGLMKGEVDRDFLVAQKGVALIFENELFDIKATATSFWVNIIRDSEMIFYGQNASCKFTNEILQALKRVEPGDLVLFVNIKGILPSGKETLTNSIEFTIK